MAIMLILIIMGIVATTFPAKSDYRAENSLSNLGNEFRPSPKHCVHASSQLQSAKKTIVKKHMHVLTAPVVDTFNVCIYSNPNETDEHIANNTLYTNQKLEFTIIADDYNGGFDYINITVNGDLWVKMDYLGTGWSCTSYMWYYNTYIPSFDNYSSATHIEAKIYLDPLVGTDDEINQGYYQFQIIAVNVNNESSTEGLQNVDYVCFDYEPPYPVYTKKEVPINTLDNDTDDVIDPSDKVMLVIGADDFYMLKNVKVNYTYNYKDYHLIDANWNGTYWIAYIPPHQPGIVQYFIISSDYAGNVKVRMDGYNIIDPYEPILQNVTIHSKHGFYVDENINISVLVVENANSSIKKVNCTIYQSQDNRTWEFLATADFEFSKLVDGISIYQNMAELEVWNNASEWNLTISIGYYAYLKVVIGIYDVGDNTITTTKYLIIWKRHVMISCNNITTRYGDETNISFSITDQINGSIVSLYFDLYINDELVYYGYSNATGPTTITITFTEIGTFTILIYVPENQKYVGGSKTIRSCLLLGWQLFNI